MLLDLCLYCSQYPLPPYVHSSFLPTPPEPLLPSPQEQQRHGR